MLFGIKIAATSVGLVNAATAPSVQVHIHNIAMCVGAQHAELNVEGVRPVSNSSLQPVQIAPPGRAPSPRPYKPLPQYPKTQAMPRCNPEWGS